LDLQFQKEACSCLDAVVNEAQNMEQPQEIRLPDGMPDIGRVLAAWGQPVLRGKEWRDDSVALNGGTLVWVLYAPEDGTQPRCMESWIPFQMSWALPEGTAEGQLRVRMLPRFVDARSISARKLMLRGAAAVMVQAYAPVQKEIWNVREAPEDVQLLRVRHPVRLAKEAGEKPFLLDEDLTLPGSLPEPEKLISYSIRPEITDQKVMGDKVVFRGNGNLRILYRSEEGQLHSWDFPLSFSQYAQLQSSHSADARADVALCPTSLELEMDAEGHLRLKCGLVGQYLVDDLQLLDVIEDAYSPGREVQIEQSTLTLPAVMDSRRENMFAEQTLPADANLAADIRFLPDFPRMYPGEAGVRMEQPGVFQSLYYDENGTLQGASARWEGSRDWQEDPESQITAVPLPGGEPQISLSEGSMTLKSELPLGITSSIRQEIPMVTGISMGDLREPDPMRPSLVLHRAGEGRLWDIARENGSTVEAIRKANGLQEEPTPGQMLLIPVF